MFADKTHPELKATPSLQAATLITQYYHSLLIPNYYHYLNNYLIINVFIPICTEIKSKSTIWCLLPLSSHWFLILESKWSIFSWLLAQSPDSSHKFAPRKMPLNRTLNHSQNFKITYFTTLDNFFPKSSSNVQSMCCRKNAGLRIRTPGF